MDEDYNKYGRHGLHVTRVFAVIIIAAIIALPISAGVRLLNSGSDQVAEAPITAPAVVQSPPTVAVVQPVAQQPTAVVVAPPQTPEVVVDPAPVAAEESVTAAPQIAVASQLASTGELPNTGSASVFTTFLIATIVGYASYALSLRKAQKRQLF